MELEQLLNLLKIAPLKYRLFFTMVLYTGFRRSEMLGLEWKDIDWEHRVISVRRISNYTSERGIYTDTTKTESSVRFVKVPPEVIDILRQYKAEQDLEREKLGDKWHDTDRLFVKFDGQPMNPQTPYGWLKDFCERNNFPFHGIHQFRHYAASSLIAAGLDVTTVSGALGHCNSGTTLNTYSHMFQTAQARVAEAMDSAFGFLQTLENKA